MGASAHRSSTSSFDPQGWDEAGAWHSAFRKECRTAGDALLGRFPKKLGNGSEPSKQKSSPLVERNDLTLWAQANAVGGCPQGVAVDLGRFGRRKLP
jgi:hypothetical protein